MQAYSEKQYLDMLQQLLPSGAAWPREEGAVRDGLMGATAAELNLVDMAVIAMILESNPLNTVIMLPEWEELAGLPDECSQDYETMAERRAAVVAKVTNKGGNSLEYLIGVASDMSGVPCTGYKCKPFEAGVSTAGDALTNDPWRYWFVINVPETVVRRFTAGASCAGEPLATWGNERVECTINTICPAEGQACFTYGGDNG